MGNFDRGRVRSETGSDRAGPGSAPGGGVPDRRRGPAHELTIGFGIFVPNRSRTDRPGVAPARDVVAHPPTPVRSGPESPARTLLRAVAAGRRSGWARSRLTAPSVVPASAVRVIAAPVIAAPVIAAPVIAAPVIAVLLIAAALAAVTGRLVPFFAAIGRFVDFYAGVFALVALSVSVMVGLLATDRMVLLAWHRLRAQAVHRAAAFTAVAMLAIHVLSQVLRDRAGIDAFVPFAGHAAGFGIRLGTVACYLLILVIGTAVARGRFAASTRPWLWRTLHCAAYVAWPLAIAHGLTSGRTPAGWVTASYGLCLAAVVLAVTVRFLPRTHRRRQG